jgi:very-short-patch-repair endonuclease
VGDFSSAKTKKSMKESNHYYNKNLKQLAAQKRKNSTTAEIVIWNNLLKGKRLGVKFLRQRPIHNYIVDFFCKELSLIIEIDGYSHTLDEIKEKDNRREAVLTSLGFEIIRFTDKRVLEDINNVEISIMSKIAELSKK